MQDSFVILSRIYWPWLVNQEKQKIENSFFFIGKVVHIKFELTGQLTSKLNEWTRQLTSKLKFYVYYLSNKKKEFSIFCFSWFTSQLPSQFIQSIEQSIQISCVLPFK